MARRPQVTLDITAASPAFRRPLIDAVLRESIASGLTDVLNIVYDHEPVGLGYELELRKDTRGKFDFDASQRSDGCWLARLTPRV